MYTEIIKVIEGGLVNDKEKVFNYATVLANNLEQQGELSLAQKIRAVLNKKNLYLQGLYRDHIEQRAILERFVPNQEFCLIITIRDPEKESNVYDEVTQGLDAYNFWHSNIKISSEVSSRLEL